MPEYFNRPPRIQPELPEGEIAVPSPPSRDSGRQSLVQLALPLITVVGYVLVSGARGGGAGSLLFVIPMALSIVLSTTVAVFNFIRDRRIDAEKRLAYRQHLVELRRDMEESHDRQRHFYAYNYPDPASLIRMASERTEGHINPRLWERRTSDTDFGAVRLGLGTVPSTVIYKLSKNSDADSTDELQDALKLASDSEFVDNVPITVPLRSHYAIDNGKRGQLETMGLHAIGIAGAEVSHTSDFVRSTLVHFAAFHAPADARLYVIGSPESQKYWDWASWLPHCNTSRNESKAGDQLAFSPDKVRRLWDDQLQPELERRQLRLADDSSGDVTLPFLLVVIDGLTATGEPVKGIESEPTVAILLQRGLELGAAVIFLVTDRDQIPSDCKAVIEVASAENTLAFRYAEVGVNTKRYDGIADTVDARIANQDFARRLAPMSSITSYGADLALAVSLLELNKKQTVDELPLLEWWSDSRKPENADWLSVPVGLLVGNKIRELKFSADGDGVHGLAAGTTGSGKSELLLTIIVGLAVRYDPSIVNFVLVDYKGGSAFEPFRTLPHCVDIVTNLQGMAGARTFIALRAELNRRSKILADANVKHIVHYRQKNLHETRAPFPHLFVIIDEFAEMIKEMPEFKAQLDSIARLGRALGVHLILATQRPSGVVSDQIRANMKFRICLRVETPEDSRELLRRSDAAFLPPNIPGRAYLQVGNENVELMQVARAGGPYSGPQVDNQPPVIWLNERNSKVMDKPRMNTDSAALSDVIVSIAVRLATENPDIIKVQRKPWPDPLPLRLPLDAESVGETPNPLLPLNRGVQKWMEGTGTWQPIDWTDQAMRTVVGLIDNPHRAEQLIMTLDLTRGHAVVFGASGWGKTTFLRTVITGLAATHSPEELIIYIMDFGGRGLDVLKALPHVGATINPSEDERVQRLLRRLATILEERKAVLSQAQADNLSVYNANHPDKIIPAILVVLDNYAQFKENFENFQDTLISIVRDARAYGIHFVFTAEQTNAMPGKLFSLFTERMALKLADPTEVASVVGRNVPAVSEIAGRGFVAVDRAPLEFQTALPVGVTSNEEAAGLDDAKKLGIFAKLLSDAWKGKRPEPIEVLRPIIPLRSILPANPPEKVQTILGLEDLDLKPALLDLQLKGPHFLVLGPPLSGKTTTMRTWALSLAQMYAPERVAMVLIDFQQRFFRYGGKHTLGDLPHVLTTIAEPGDMTPFVTNLKAEYEGGQQPGRELFILVDSYDDFATVVGSSTSKTTVYKDLGEMARKFGPAGLHFVLCGSQGILRQADELMRQVIAPHYGLGLDASETVTALGGRARSGSGVEFPPGRGYIVRSGRISLIQVATPQNENNVEESLDAWVDDLIERWPQRAQWSNPPVIAEVPLGEVVKQQAK